MIAEEERQKAEEIPLAELVIPRVEKAMPTDFPGEPYLGLDDIEAHTTRLLGWKPSATMKSSAKRFYPGDVLYSRLRPYLNKVWFADRSGLCSAEFIVLPQHDAIDGRFLKYRLSAKDFVSFANSLNAGDRPRVDFDQISAFCLPPFSLAHQRRIVAKIEELFSELDAGEESLRKARRQLGVYRQSLLKQAFEGKLTAAWREQNPQLLESPKQLLARIQAERQARYEVRLKEWKKTVKDWEAGKLKSKKPIKPREAEVVPLTKDAISDLPVLPSPWMWTSLSELSDHIVDGTHKTPKYVDHGVQFISAKDINDFSVSFANTKFITSEEHEELWRRCKPCGGDILLTKSGTIGRVAVVKVDHEFSVFESVAVVPISRSVEPQFFAFQIYCTVQGSFGAANQKGVGVRHLHLEDIRRLPTSLPSLPEQQEIVRLLDEQFTVIEQNEREIDTALKRSEALRQSILKKAFSGQLVVQDPADEPASILLERIRAEREAAKQSPRKITRVPKAKPAPEIGEDFFSGIAPARPRKPKPASTPGKTDLQAGIVALAIVAHEDGSEHLGHVKAEKIVHLCDVIARLQLDRRPVKGAAGPNDTPQAKKVEHRAKMQGWFTVKKKPGAKAYTYQRDRNFDRLVQDTEIRLGSQLQTIRDLIDDLAAMSVKDAELVATVHAAWNNLLLRGEDHPGEEAIVREAREDWHRDKLKIDRYRFFEAIAWIQQSNLKPTGVGQIISAKKAMRANPQVQ